METRNLTFWICFPDDLDGQRGLGTVASQKMIKIGGKEIGALVVFLPATQCVTFPRLCLLLCDMRITNLMDSQGCWQGSGIAKAIYAGKLAYRVGRNTDFAVRQAWM